MHRLRSTSGDRARTSRETNDGGHSYVYKQPESPEEEALCKEAMEGCPVEAIGDDSEYYIAPAI